MNKAIARGPYPRLRRPRCGKGRGDPVVTKERGAPGVALVIGAVCGIGFEVARQFARRGMMVILGARDAENGEAATEELAGTVDVAEGEG